MCLIYLIILGHLSLAVRAYKRTSKDIEENVSSVLHGNPTSTKKMCTSERAKVTEVTQEPGEERQHQKNACRKMTEGETDKHKKYPFNVTVNINMNS